MMRGCRRALGAGVFSSFVLAFGAAPALEEPKTQVPLGGEYWGANFFPNVSLVTHEGKTVRFFDDLVKGKVVVINFMYTTCRDVCPLETAKLTELQSILGERVGKDVFMYSITVDPETDSPDVLKEYAERYQVGPGWLFLTGKASDIVLLRRRLGLFSEEDEEAEAGGKKPRGAKKDHNVSLLIGNQTTGRWMKRSPFENPYFLASQVGSWLHNWKTPASTQDSYANAPALRKPSQGETLFRTRCAACHAIGDGDNVPLHQRLQLLGPDLLNVTKNRDRKWLSRWLAEPDKMLDEKDPLGMELFAKYGGVAMPNMSLGERDVTALLLYLETESYRVERARVLTGQAPVAPAKAEAEGSCCQKGAAALVGGDDGSASRAGAEPAPKSTYSLVNWNLCSAGLGCLFLIASAFARRRAAA